VTLLACRFALDPAPAQQRGMRSHPGAARVAFTWGLAQVKANLCQREAVKSCGITGEDLTPPVSWSLSLLRKDWNAAKDMLAPWWGECSKEALTTGLDQLCRAVKNWPGSRKGKPKGKPVGLPRVRSKRKARPSIRFTTGAFGCERGHGPAKDRAGQSPPARRPARGARGGRYGTGDGRVRAVRAGPLVRRVHRRTGRQPPGSDRPDAVAGLDLGIKTPAVLSTGEVLSSGEAIPNPRDLDAALRTVRRLSRTVSRRRDLTGALGPCRRTGAAVPAMPSGRLKAGSRTSGATTSTSTPPGSPPGTGRSRSRT